MVQLPFPRSSPCPLELRELRRGATARALAERGKAAPPGVEPLHAGLGAWHGGIING